LAAVDHAVAGGFDTQAWQLAWALWDYLDWKGHWHAMAATAQTAVQATTRIAEACGRIGAHRNLARAYIRLDRYDDAHAQLTRALELADEFGDRAALAHTHLYLGILLGTQGRHQEALSHSQRAVELFRAADDRASQASALNNLGWCYA